MVYRAELSLYSTNGEDWVIDWAHYVVVPDPRIGSLGRLKMENMQYVEGLLKRGDVLIKRQWKKET